MENNFFTDRFQGDIFPQRIPVLKQPPFWPDDKINPNDGKYKLGGSERYFVNVKIYAQMPNMQYPRSSIKIGFLGANRKSVFTTVNLSDLRGMASFLVETADKLEGIMPQLQAAEQKAREANMAWSAIMQSENVPQSGQPSEGVD